MNLEQFGKELKQVRLERKISLVDISAETRINLRFLEAVENGQFHILPQTYVRAFLKEYALMINIDPNEILQRYDSARKETSSRKLEEEASRHLSIQDKISTRILGGKFFPFSPLRRSITLGIVIIIAIVLVVILADENKNTEISRHITEVPFDRVIRESEAASISRQIAGADSTQVYLTPQKDSLRLQIMTIDSVWISILIDDTKAEEYLFGANRRRTWVAKERFVITMGNAGGASFRLNGKDIGFLGKQGAVVRNAVISEVNLNN